MKEEEKDVGEDDVQMNATECLYSFVTTKINGSINRVKSFLFEEIGHALTLSKNYSDSVI